MVVGKESITPSILWKRFRRSRRFLPTVIAVPALLVAGTGVGVYSAWDATRIDIPSVVGQELPDGAAVLRELRLGVEEPIPLDDALASNCYIISAQSVPPGTRIVPEETEIVLDVEPDLRPMPDVVGISLTNAKEKLLASCLHEEVLHNWCMPKEFSGLPVVLETEDFTKETGFTFDLDTKQLKHSSLAFDESWIVCDQSEFPTTDLAAGTHAGLMLTIPLTTVPEMPNLVIDQVLDSFAETADGCSLRAEVTATFAANPAAVKNVQLPATKDMTGWEVLSLTPTVGHALLCGAPVNVEVAWPSTTTPQLVGLHHVPDSSNSATATTAALETAGLKTSCSGKGTVTSQVPAAGLPVPLGTAITCVAELVVPSIIGLDPTTAAAVLAAAGVEGSVLGTGVVVSQAPLAGTVLTGSGKVTYYAEAPKPAPFSSGGGAYYKNCTAVRAAGAAPLYRGEPGYQPKLDRDGDGVACE